MKVAIVGSGPAAHYLTERLRTIPGIQRINIIERLSSPHGLLNYGVAPDHPEVKAPTRAFNEALLGDPRMRLFLGVQVGRDISLRRLAQAHTATVICTGAAVPRIPPLFRQVVDPSLPVLSSAELFGWYNKMPGYADSIRPGFLATVHAVLIVGQGNVAIDVARLLGSPVSEQLRRSDANLAAIGELDRSAVRTVNVMGRRGPLQASFTTAELRELLDSQSLHVSFEFKSLDEELAAYRDLLPRGQRRMLELMQRGGKGSGDSERRVVFHFYQNPIGIQKDAENAISVKIEHSTNARNYTNYAEIQSAATKPTGHTSELKCNLVVLCTGFEGARISDPNDLSLPYRSRDGCLENLDGRIKGLPGLYCAGWAATGPQGNLAATLNNAKIVAQSIQEDLPGLPPPTTSLEDLLDRIPHRSKEDWFRADQLEVRSGEYLGKSREKLLIFD